MTRFVYVLLTTILLLGTVVHAQQETEVKSVSPDEVIAVVNGKSLTAGQLQWQFYSQQLSGSTAAQREQMLQQLIDRELMRQYLKRRRVVADPERIKHQISIVKAVIEKGEENVDDVLKRMQLTEERLSELLEVSIAWKQHVQATIKQPEIATQFKKNRIQWDGTRVKAAQIFIAVPADTDEEAWKETGRKLNGIRQQILRKSTTFAEAAKEHSQSPSGKSGGELTPFEFTNGLIARPIREAAFALKVGDVSKPFRSPGGVHLVTVTGHIPGQLSLEDVRDDITSKLGQELWNKRVGLLRRAAKIQIIGLPGTSE